jgi:ribosomal-protein-serine acetyltransferase
VFRLEVAPNVEARLLKPADADAIFALVDYDRAYLREWLPWVDRTHTADDVRLFITGTVMPQWHEGRGPQCGIWIEGALGGSIGCHAIDWLNRSCSIGYWIASRHQRRGIVTRCAEAMIDYLFGELGLHRVVIQCGTDNLRSCAVPERLGFTREGIAREAEWAAERWVDLVVWSMLRHEWEGDRR